MGKWVPFARCGHVWLKPFIGAKFYSSNHCASCRQNQRFGLGFALNPPLQLKLEFERGSGATGTVPRRSER